MKLSLSSIVIPVYNEQANLPELIKRCLDVCRTLDHKFELILVDDGSKDESARLIQEASEANPGEVIGILLNRNYGQHAAVMAGLAETRGEAIVTLDADLQNPPEEIPRLLEKIEEGCDVVGSVRTMRKDSLFRKVSSRLINAAVRKATGVMMHDYGCMLRAYRREVVDAMLQCNERSTFIPVLANSFASKTAEIAVSHAERSADESKYDIWKLINLQFDLLTSMTTAPLRILSILGGSLAVLGFAFGVMLLLLRLFIGPEWAAQGVFTLIAFVFIFMGIQLLGMGMLGEYIGRIYTDVRARPRYFVQQVFGRDATGKPHPEERAVTR